MNPFRRSDLLEWRIALRHLEGAETAPAWAGVVGRVALFLTIVGAAFAFYGAAIGSPQAAGTDWGAGVGRWPWVSELFADISQLLPSELQRRQQWVGTLGGFSIAIGVMLGLFAVLARKFTLLSTVITMSVLLGCMHLVVVLSLMSGLEQDLQAKILGQKAHIRISKGENHVFSDYEALIGGLSSIPEVAGASPYLRGEVLVRSGQYRKGAVLLGIEPERLARVSNLRSMVEKGSFDAIDDPASIPVREGLEARRTETPWRLRHLERQRSDEAEAAARSSVGDSGPQGEETSTSHSGPSFRGGQVSRGADSAGHVGAREEPGPAAGRLTGLGSVAQPAQRSKQPKVGRPERNGPDSGAGVKATPNAGGSLLGPARAGSGLLRPRGFVPPVPAAVEGGEEGDDWGEWEDPAVELGLEEAADGSGENPVGKPSGPDTPADEGSDEPAEPGAEEEDDDRVFAGVLVGRELAKELGTRVGARLRLITPDGPLTPAGRKPGIRDVRVGGIFYSGMYQYDQTHVYADLETVQVFLRRQKKISGIEVRLVDPDAIEAGRRVIEALLNRTPGAEGLEVETWKELNRNLFAAMFLEKIAMFIALMFVVLVASFGIWASNLMSVLEKAKEIAILKAMGCSDQQIRRIFIIEGICLGFLGAAGGIAVGLLMCWVLDRYGFPFNDNAYYIDKLPVVVDPTELVVIGVAALVIVFVASLYPAKVASSMRPVDGLRHGEN